MSVVKRCDRCGAEGRYSLGSGVDDWSTLKLKLRVVGGDGLNTFRAAEDDRHLCPDCAVSLDRWLRDAEGGVA